MPKIERQSLVSEDVGDTNEFLTTGFIDYAAFSQLGVPKTIDVTLSPNVLVSSLQIEVSGGSHGAFDAGGRPLEHFVSRNKVSIHRGPFIPYIIQSRKLNWEIISLNRGIERLGDAAFTILGVDKDDSPTGFLTPLPDGGVRMFFSIFRPSSFSAIEPCFFNTSPNCQTRLFNRLIWPAYDVHVEVTGFVTTDFPQGTGINEEQISCFVKDNNSKDLYGTRLSQNEEQSDFIETQRQACRVAESIIRDQNQVIEINFLLPFRPAINRGQTIRVQNLAKGIDLHGIVKSYAHTFDTDSATVTTQVTLRTTEYTFRTSLINLTKGSEEIIDLRQTS